MYTTTARCTANVTLSRGRVKEYSGRNVYLKDSQEFELELYNPHTKPVLAKISINGTLLSGGGLVLKPAQRVYLERYLDTNHRFKFGTYEVEGTSEAKKAIAQNGKIRVEFYLEKDQVVPVYGTTTTWIVNPPNPWNGLTNPYTYTGSRQSNLAGNSGNQEFASLHNLQNINMVNTNLTSSLSYSSHEPEKSPIETGRVEKGNSSTQVFENVEMDFNYYYTDLEEIKLLPLSQKPQEISEIRQYCTSCSTRIKKSSWKFCPTCGASLED